MTAPRPRRKLPWYVIVLIAGLGLAVVACGVLALAATSAPLTQGAQEMAGTLSDLTDVHAKIVREYGLKPEDVGVQITFQILTSSKSGTGRSQILVVTLVNSRFNELGTNATNMAMRDIAAFADDSYYGKTPIDSVCVSLVKQSSFLIFKSSQNQSSCYSARWQ